METSQPDNCAAFLPHHYRGVTRAGFLLGFALGGFFDGILLHQILQWHHLLSALEQAPFSDMRVQILADGVFHALMYVIGFVGLRQLLKARHALIGPAADRLLTAGVLLGFGSWHVVDALLSHWLLGIHHIRMDVPNPLLWDLLWLGVFGLVPLITGLVLLRHPSSPDDHDRRAKSHSALAPMLAVAMIAAAVASAALPVTQNGTRMVTVLLRPDATPAQLLAGVPNAGARTVWNSQRGEVWVFALERDANPLSFYRHGALFVSGTLMPAGCASWFRL